MPIAKQLRFIVTCFLIIITAPNGRYIYISTAHNTCSHFVNNVRHQNIRISINGVKKTAFIWICMFGMLITMKNDANECIFDIFSLRTSIIIIAMTVIFGRLSEVAPVKILSMQHFDYFCFWLHRTSFFVRWNSWRDASIRKGKSKREHKKGIR